MTFFKIRQISTGKYLLKTGGFYDLSGTTYNTVGGAKAAYSGYQKRNSWRGSQLVTDAEIVMFEAKEVSTHKL